MRQDLTDITIVLDRSGSMTSVREDTIGGYNSFIAAQCGLPGRATISLVQFDNEYETVYSGVDCLMVKRMEQRHFQPRGSTALCDAIGRTINFTGERLSALREAQRPGKVVIVTLTDGIENASKKFKREQVAAMVKHQREVYGWEFVFLGANQDAVLTGESLGVPKESSLTYAHDANGVSTVMDSASCYVGNLRSVGKASFGAADRERQER